MSQFNSKIGLKGPVVSIAPASSVEAPNPVAEAGGVGPVENRKEEDEFIVLDRRDFEALKPGELPNGLFGRSNYRADDGGEKVKFFPKTGEIQPYQPGAMGTFKITNPEATSAAQAMRQVTPPTAAPVASDGLDKWGNPIDPTPRDKWGNPIDPNAPALDKWGNPVDPTPRDKWGNPIK